MLSAFFYMDIYVHLAVQGWGTDIPHSAAFCHIFSPKSYIQYLSAQFRVPPYQFPAPSGPASALPGPIPAPSGPSSLLPWPSEPDLTGPVPAFYHLVCLHPLAQSLPLAQSSCPPWPSPPACRVKPCWVLRHSLPALLDQICQFPRPSWPNPFAPPGLVLLLPLS